MDVDFLSSSSVRIAQSRSETIHLRPLSVNQDDVLSANLLDKTRILLVIDMCSERDFFDGTAARDVSAFERFDMIWLADDSLR